MMNIVVSGHSLLGLGNEFKTYAEERIRLNIETCLSEYSSTKIVVWRRNHLFELAITVNEGVGRHFLQYRSDARASDVHYAFDLALNHLTEQITDFKINEGVMKA